MHTRPTTLVLTLMALLVLAPAAHADDGCATLATDHEPGAGKFRVSPNGYGRLDIMVPGPGPDGEMGTHYLLIDYGDIKKCIGEVLP